MVDPATITSIADQTDASAGILSLPTIILAGVLVVLTVAVLVMANRNAWIASRTQEEPEMELE